MKTYKLNFVEGPRNKVRKRDITNRIKLVMKVMDKIMNGFKAIKFNTDNDN